MELKVNEITNILIAPGTFKNLNNLGNNIIAYSQLEYIEGYMTATFGGTFKEALDFIDDYKTYETFIESMQDYIDTNKDKFKNMNEINKLLAFIKISLIHNIYKRNRSYNL